MNHVMLDLETLGTSADAVILSIGAVVFDPNEPGSSHQELYETGIQIDFQDRTISDGTLRWWLQQGDKARYEHYTPGDHLGEVLERLKAFMDHHNPKGVWGNGADFDNAIIQHAWGQMSRNELLYPFWANRCFRTFTNLFDPDRALRPQSNDHNALNDCWNQINWMWNIVREHGVTVR